MGATEFFVKKKGSSAKDAYQEAVEDAIDEHGNDSYNGSISTTRGFTDVTAEYRQSDKNIREFMKYKLDKAGKRDCFAVCLEEPKENLNKIKSLLINKPYKGTREWKIFYKVTSMGGANSIFKSESREAAIKAARNYTETNKVSTRIHMTRELIGSDPEIAEIHYKKSSSEKLGVWQFFGYAAY